MKLSLILVWGALNSTVAYSADNPGGTEKNPLTVYQRPHSAATGVAQTAQRISVERLLSALDPNAKELLKKLYNEGRSLPTQAINSAVVTALGTHPTFDSISQTTNNVLLGVHNTNFRGAAQPNMVAALEKVTSVYINQRPHFISNASISLSSLLQFELRLLDSYAILKPGTPLSLGPKILFALVDTARNRGLPSTTSAGQSDNYRFKPGVASNIAQDFARTTLLTEEYISKMNPPGKPPSLSSSDIQQIYQHLLKPYISPHPNLSIAAANQKVLADIFQQLRNAEDAITRIEELNGRGSRPNGFANPNGSQNVRSARIAEFQRSFGVSHVIGKDAIYNALRQLETIVPDGDLKIRIRSSDIAERARRHLGDLERMLRQASTDPKVSGTAATPPQSNNSEFKNPWARPEAPTTQPPTPGTQPSIQTTNTAQFQTGAPNQAGSGKGPQQPPSPVPIGGGSGNNSGSPNYVWDNTPGASNNSGAGSNNGANAGSPNNSANNGAGNAKPPGSVEPPPRGLIPPGPNPVPDEQARDLYDRMTRRITIQTGPGGKPMAHETPDAVSLKRWSPGRLKNFLSTQWIAHPSLVKIPTSVVLAYGILLGGMAGQCYLTNSNPVCEQQMLELLKNPVFFAASVLFGVTAYKADTAIFKNVNGQFKPSFAFLASGGLASFTLAMTTFEVGWRAGNMISACSKVLQREFAEDEKEAAEANEQQKAVCNAHYDAFVFSDILAALPPQMLGALAGISAGTAVHKTTGKLVTAAHGALVKGAEAQAGKMPVIRGIALQVIQPGHPVIKVLGWTANVASFLGAFHGTMALVNEPYTQLSKGVYSFDETVWSRTPFPALGTTLHYIFGGPLNWAWGIPNTSVEEADLAWAQWRDEVGSFLTVNGKWLWSQLTGKFYSNEEVHRETEKKLSQTPRIAYTDMVNSFHRFIAKDFEYEKELDCRPAAPLAEKPSNHRVYKTVRDTIVPLYALLPDKVARDKCLRPVQFVNALDGYSASLKIWRNMRLQPVMESFGKWKQANDELEKTYDYTKQVYAMIVKEARRLRIEANNKPLNQKNIQLRVEDLPAAPTSELGQPIEPALKSIRLAKTPRLVDLVIAGAACGPIIDPRMRSFLQHQSIVLSNRWPTNFLPPRIVATPEIWVKGEKTKSGSLVMASICDVAAGKLEDDDNVTNGMWVDPFNGKSLGEGKGASNPTYTSLLDYVIMNIDPELLGETRVAVPNRALTPTSPSTPSPFKGVKPPVEETSAAPTLNLAATPSNNQIIIQMPTADAMPLRIPERRGQILATEPRRIDIASPVIPGDVSLNALRFQVEETLAARPEVEVDEAFEKWWQNYINKFFFKEPGRKIEIPTFWNEQAKKYQQVVEDVVLPAFYNRGFAYCANGSYTRSLGKLDETETECKLRTDLSMSDPKFTKHRLPIGVVYTVRDEFVVYISALRGLHEKTATLKDNWKFTGSTITEQDRANFKASADAAIANFNQMFSEFAVFEFGKRSTSGNQKYELLVPEVLKALKNLHLAFGLDGKEVALYSSFDPAAINDLPYIPFPQNPHGAEINDEEIHQMSWKYDLTPEKKRALQLKVAVASLIGKALDTVATLSQYRNSVKASESMPLPDGDLLRPALNKKPELYEAQATWVGSWMGWAQNYLFGNRQNEE